jgi:hypothetical protein
MSSQKTQVAKLKIFIYLVKLRLKKSVSKNPNGIIVPLYFLGKLGISEPKLFDQTVESIKHQDEDSIETMYGLTHIIFTKSDYLDRYLDPSGYKKEIEIFQRVLSKYALKEKFSVGEADWLSEIIISLKILRQDNDKYVRLISDKLIKCKTR